MAPKLAAAIERARSHKMTPQERFEQRVSFVYGQQDWSSGNARAKEEIRAMLIDLCGYPAMPTPSNEAEHPAPATASVATPSIDAADIEGSPE